MDRNLEKATWYHYLIPSLSEKAVNYCEMSVVEVSSYQHWTSIMPKNGFLAVDCYADWCQPCRAISPVFEQLAKRYASKSFVFAKINVDNQQQVASSLNVRSMPTFLFFENGRQVDMLVGANRDALMKKVEALAKRSNGLTGDSSIPAALVARGFTNLASMIEKRQLECLNQDDDHPLIGLFNGKGNYLESDVDEQLMIYIPFLEAVKIHSIAITPTEDISYAPAAMKLFINLPNVLSFEDADSLEATQEFTEIKYDKANEPVVVPLRFVKFQRVNSLVIFISKNVGDEDTTRLANLQLIGEPVGGSSNGKLTKIDD
ncbi:thioredoxin-like I protein Txl1 [Schizosaccharomyces japonicus yFS275]|uniref:Thioredoxin-like I protein Txl1 n=1 Tax=Schizosaccharomyces japonicus (strain yFS275 / FY16936) TaxID=402676 RepID=B6K736_SCHJY|nr:thioredoxin-like I protein Txl1 [Schizosaccharomyces japonicus yFS275]EEB09340.2 thioredoxin-like I protein Txl1 [Schizosaccharomyces japonicus yFS275]